MGAVLVGTCSWTDPSLLKAGTFYPPEATDAESRLRFYGQQFPIVEVDSTYYGLPVPSVVQRWADRTGDHFKFDIKAFSLFTNHPTDPKSLPREVYRALAPALTAKRRLYFADVPEELRSELWLRFKTALAPLASAGKLGLILLQFPPWFRPSPSSKDHIVHCAECLEPLRCSVEFRSSGWLAEREQHDTLDFLRANGLAFVCVDEPQGFGSSVPPVAEATADVAVIRFHGRNSATWEQKGLTASQRFDWYYGEDEMGEWVPRIRKLAEQAEEVHALMNTNNGDQGVVNGRLLQRLLL